MKIHLDLDCYFVSAERTRYQFLKGKNVVIAKSSDKKIFSNNKKEGVILGDTGAFNSIMEFRNNYDTKNILKAWKDEFLEADGKILGIVIAKSYETKRYGIKTGMSLREALSICKDLIIIPSDHLFYQELSQKLKAYLELKIPLLEQYSIDEFFGDITGWIKDEDTESFIRGLRDEILEKFDLPITIGASNSKWIAKLITDKAKPFGAKVLFKKEIEPFTDNIPIEEFPGIGRAIYKRLSSYGIRTLGDLRSAPSLLNRYGKTGKELYKRICGMDEELVMPHHDRRAICISRNFKPIIDRNEMNRRVMILARYISHTIVKLGLNPTTFYFKLRYEHGVKSAVSITENRLFNERFFIDLALSICRKLDIYTNYKIHYIAMSASNFTNLSNPKTFSLLEYEKDRKMADLNAGLVKIRDKYGVDAVRYGREEIVV